MPGKKLYYVKTKDGAHINEKLKADGSRAALQFDDENSLLGPVDLIEADESEYIREVYMEPEYDERGLGQRLMEDAIIPALSDALTDAVCRITVSALNAAETWVLEKGIPAVKAKGAELFNTARGTLVTKEPGKAGKKQTGRAVKQSSEIAAVPVRSKSRTVVHSPEEVDQILNNMKYAALYIAAGIRELSETVILDDGADPQKIVAMQQKLNELSSEEVMNTIGFMLEDRNRDALDQATIRLFEAFRQKEFIVEGEAVPISRYLQLAS